MGLHAKAAGAQDDPGQGAGRVARRTTNQGLGGKSQPARLATVQVRAARVLLDTPREMRCIALRRVNVVYAVEVNPPAGVSEPIDWMLLTSEPVNHARGALRIIGYYRRRWVIEEYHKVQKSGCGLEHSQLQDVDALGGDWRRWWEWWRCECCGCVIWPRRI